MAQHLAGLKKRAAFDLSCPVEQLQTQELATRSYGVIGCGKKATYNLGVGNVWILNSDTHHGDAGCTPAAAE